MAWKDSTPEQAIGMLREAEGRLPGQEDRQDLPGPLWSRATTGGGGPKVGQA
jgi:hypothetical protein